MRILQALIVTALAVSAQTPDPRELVRQAFAQDENIFNSVQDYTYTEHETRRSLDAKGKVTSTEQETSEVLYLYGRQYSKLVAKDGKPLSPSEAKKEEAKAEREVNRRKREADRGNKDPDDTAARRRKAAREIADAFDFRIVGTEDVAAGRGINAQTWLIDATPRRGYQAKTREAKLYAKTSGRLWINQADHSLVKAKIRVDDTISFGYFLFRLAPGARVEFERTHLAANVWLPKHFFVKGEAKIGMVKTYRVEVEREYSDYKKFQTESTVTLGAAAP